LPFIGETKSKTKKMKRIHLIYFVLIASVVLMIFNIAELDFENLKKGPFARIVSNVLLILAMLVTIRDIKKKENN
jgi:hypothetical protein